MNRKELLEKVRNCTPNLGWDYEYPELFGKYGFMTCGICETWIWFDENNISDKAREKGLKPLTYASDEELLEMWGMCSSYWLEQYESGINVQRKNRLSWIILLVSAKENILVMIKMDIQIKQ